MSNKKISVGIYCRLSEEDKNKENKEDDSVSIKNQLLLLMNYAKEQGWCVYDIYRDDDWTGADRSRPEFNRIINDAREGKINIILCKTQSRFTREIEIVEKYLHNLFPSWGVRFIGLVDNADTAIKANKKSRQINGLVNEWYLEDMSENIKSVLTARRKEGYYIGATALYGYIKDPKKKGHLIIDQEAAEVVRLVFQSFADGMGKSSIARMLNDKGIPNPTEYKRLKGISYKTPPHKAGTLWKYFAISDMLINEMYIGNMVQGKYGSISYKTHENKPIDKEKWIVVENTHEAIIDKELWIAVQNLIKAHAKPFIMGDLGLFAKKVKCKHCGYYMCSAKNHGYHYLRCPTKKVAQDACVGSFISVRKLESIVMEELKQINNMYLDKEKLQNELIVNYNIREKIKRIEEKIGMLRHKESQIDNALKNIYLDKIKEVISQDQFMVLSSELSNDKEHIKADIIENTNALNECNEILEKGSNKKQLIDEYVDAECLTRPMVDKLIDFIEVSHRDENTKLMEVEIHWNY